MLTRLCKKLDTAVLWVAHRRELIGQAANHLDEIGFRDYVVTSVQKQARRPIPDGVGLIVIDECHHAIRDSQYQKLFEAGLPVVGATATPFRLDGRGLGDMFKSLVVAATPKQLVKEGYIQDPTIYSHPAPDMTGAKRIGGDWSMRETGRRSNKPKIVADIVDTWRQRADGMKTIGFACTIDHSKAVVASFVREGIPAEHLDGTTPKQERDDILGRLGDGITLVVSNVGIATEGFDLPALDCAITARPTASLCLWLQMCGRIMRREGEALILDHSGNAIRHGSPLQDIEYSLDVTTKQKSESLGLKICPGCLLMVRYGAWRCPDCGYDLSPIAKVHAKQEAGELVLFRDKEEVWMQIDGDRDKYKIIFGEAPVVIDGQLVQPNEANKKMIYEHFCQIAWDRGYKMGWARLQYKRIYGHWPGSALNKIVTGLLNTKWRK